MIIKTNLLPRGSGNPLKLASAHPYLGCRFHLWKRLQEKTIPFQAIPLLLGWLLSAPLAASAASYYASPSGSASGDGSSSRPWNMETALSGKYGRARAGDTVWLMGGTYRGNYYSDLLGTASAPVVVRAQPGQRAILDGTICQASGGYVTYWGFEIMRSYTDHDSTQSGSEPTDLPIVMGMNLKAPGIKLINMIIHDQVSNGVGMWREAPNSEIYGCVFFNNGWDGSDRGHGHGMYVQNEEGSKRILDNISFNNYSDGLQIYGTSATYLYNITVEGNVLVNNGIISRWPGGNNMQLGGGNAAQGIVVRSNYTYTGYASGKVNVGSEARNQDIRFENNVIVGPLRMANWHSAYFRNNLVAAPNTLLELWQQYESFSSSTHSWDQNRYFSQELQWRPFSWVTSSGSSARDYASWKSATGFDQNSSYAKGRPTGLQVYVRPNAYENGRGHVAIYNFDQLSTVSVDVSSILESGAQFEVRNAQDYFAAPVLSGTYNGQRLVLPMTGLSVARPLGKSSAPPPTGPDFNAFVVLTVGGGTPPPPPPPPPPAPSDSMSNTSLILIPASGSASPYPSSIAVSDLPGSISKVTVTMNGFTHSYPDDVDILLVAPNGKKVLLMSDAGGGSDANNLTLTFDDSASGLLPDSSSFSSGAYKPSNYGGSDVFSGVPSTETLASSLSALNGSSPNGTWTLLVVDDAGGDSGRISGGWSLKVTTGSAAAPLTQTFSQSGAVAVPDQGAASPNPSLLSVSGMSGNISKVTVSLLGLTHTYPDDLDMLLVSPSGQKVMLMSDAGGGNGLSAINLVFEDTAAALPDSARINTGTYQPSNYGSGDTFPAPAPAGPYASTLSAFNGVSPNGTWSLYITDDQGGDKGSLAGGWKLTITTTASAGTQSLASEQPQALSRRKAEPGTEEGRATPAVIRSVRMAPSGQAVLLISWHAGQTYMVEASSDHITWTVLDTVVAEAEIQEVIDPEASQHTLRFYRVRQTSNLPASQPESSSRIQRAAW